MKYIQLILVFVTFVLINSCNTHKTKQITNSKDYQSYLQIDKNIALQNATSELNFWDSKLKNSKS